jgi:hypothetical protein
MIQVMRTLCLWIVLLVLVQPSAARSEPLEKKNVEIAVLLAIDPVPVDSLAYAGKTGQAIANGVLGALGVGLLAGGLANYHTVEDGDDYDDTKNLSIALGGLVLYAAALLWDGIGGVVAVNSHNRDVEAKRSARRFDVQPMVQMTANGMTGGLRVEF